MSIECVENVSPPDSLSDRLTETLRWTAVSIAKIIAVSVVVFGLLIIGLTDPNKIDSIRDRVFPFMREAIEIIEFLGVCRGIKEIFFYSPPHILENYAKTTRSIVPVHTETTLRSGL